MKLLEENLKFNVLNVDKTQEEDLAKSCSISNLTARILLSRNISTPQDVQIFLNPDIDRDWNDPAIIPGLIEVADVLQQAILDNKKILVFGDFDVDGITATTVCVRGLREFGANVSGMIPHRYEEGYALTDAAMQRAMRVYDPDLIVTVDCGISCGNEVEYLLENKVDVLITDHHEPGDSVPECVPVADPKLEKDNPSGDLAGVGVALKLIQVLGERFGKPQFWRELTEFAAMGTIADLMDLTTENRALVAYGMNRINNFPRPCIVELSRVCGVNPQDISSNRLSYSLIPRLNAAGRMGDAQVAYDLLMADDSQSAQKASAALEEINNERKKAEQQLLEQVEEKLEQEFNDEEVIVVAGVGWHEGVKGIVASRIAKKYKRPTLIFTIDGKSSRGSGRSYGNINLFSLVSECSDLFERYGGHLAAVGITLDTKHLDELRQRLCKSLREQGIAPGLDAVDADAFVSLDECNVENFLELDRLQPFGHSNPVPVLAVRRVLLEQRKAVGKGKNHFSFYADDGVSCIPGISFNVEDIESALECESMCDILFEPLVDEWRGRHNSKLFAKKIGTRSGGEQEITAAQELTDSLLENAESLCDTSEYAGIANEDSFNTKVVGVSFEGRQEFLNDLAVGAKLKIVRQKDNEYDANAIAVTKEDGAQIGFLNRYLAAQLAPAIDGGQEYEAEVTAITGAQEQESLLEEQKNLGVNIRIFKPGAANAEEQIAAQNERLAQTKTKMRSLGKDELEEYIRKALIGEHDLRSAQAQTLEYLDAGKSTLTVMATGRGKSLIFHLHAAKMALLQNKASVFVYPLRALVADQAYHLQDVFERFGLRVCVLTGESELCERENYFAGLQNGTIDIVLTTPEFLTIHADLFARTGRIGFLVVDEAHHIGQSRAGNRPAYTKLHYALEQLGNPLTLAVTATASDEQAKQICQILNIEKLVLDPSIRSNMHIEDYRDLKTRNNYLAHIVSSGQKCIVYVNSRDKSIDLTRFLRKKLPTLAPYISFYNAGLSKQDRKRIEDMFRSGELRTIVSTSAFGEGIDIPDVEHVILFHVPYNDIEFNQMAGRIGRDGRDAYVHLLFSANDAKINEKILHSYAPGRQDMVALYRALMKLNEKATEQGGASFSITNAELSEMAHSMDKSAHIEPSAVSTGVSVFRELGFLQTSGQSVSRRISMVDSPKQMSLDSSVRYQEGCEEIASFSQFKTWVLTSTSKELLERFNRPILPMNPESIFEHGAQHE